MGFPTKNDHFGVFWGYHHLMKHPYLYFFQDDRKARELSEISPRRRLTETKPQDSRRRTTYTSAKTLLVEEIAEKGSMI